MKKYCSIFLLLLFCAIALQASQPAGIRRKRGGGTGTGPAGVNGAAGPAGPQTSTHTLILPIAGVLYPSSGSVTDPLLPFPEGSWAVGNTTYTILRMQLFVNSQSSTCVTSGFVSMSSGTLNASQVKYFPLMEVATAALNSANYSAKITTVAVAYANWVIAANLDRVNQCGGTPSTSARFEVDYSTGG